MEKRGISPLIATVLLIGFTILLSAIVVKWGGDFFKTEIKSTEGTIETAVNIATADVEVKNVIVENGRIMNLLIANNWEIPIDDFKIRVTGRYFGRTQVLDIHEHLDPFTSKWIRAEYDLSKIYNPDQGYSAEIGRIEVFPVFVNPESGEAITIEAHGDMIFTNPKYYAMPDDDTSLLLHFDNTLNGEDGELPLLPESTASTFKTTDLGTGIYISGSDKLAYLLTDNNFNKPEGTIEIWFGDSDSVSQTPFLFDITKEILDNNNRFYTKIIRTPLQYESNMNQGASVIKPIQISLETLNPTIHNIAITWDRAANKLNMYFDGSEKTGGTIPRDFGPGELKMRLGSQYDYTDRFNAVIYDLRISDTVRPEYR